MKLLLQVKILALTKCGFNRIQYTNFNLSGRQLQIGETKTNRGEEEMIEAYLKHEEERKSQGIPALPLTPEQTADLCKLLENPAGRQGRVSGAPDQGAGLSRCRPGC